MCGVCSKFTIKTQERRFGVFTVNFEQISYVVLVIPLLALNKETPGGRLNLKSLLGKLAAEIIQRYYKLNLSDFIIIIINKYFYRIIPQS